MAKKPSHPVQPLVVGYSLSGFADLSYVTDEIYKKASNQKAIKED